VTTTALYGMHAGTPTFTNSTAAVVTDVAAVYAATFTIGAATGITVTNSYGLLAQAPTTGTNKYAIAATASGNNTPVWKVDGAGVTTQSGALLFGAVTSINSSGVLQAAAVPALTGDMTTAGGALATTVVGAAGTFYVGTGGSKLKNNTGVVEVRNNADTLYADMKAANGTFTGDLAVTGNLNITGNINEVTITSLAVTDLVIRSNAGATNATTPTLVTATRTLGAFDDAKGAGIYVTRFSATTTRQDVGLMWDETAKQFTLTYVGGAGTTTDLRVAGFYAVACAAATTTTVTHNLNNLYPHVSVYEVTGKNLVDAEVVVIDVNSLSVNFATAPTAGFYQISVVG